MESNEPQPPTEEAASSSGQTLPLDGYISNPFSVFLKSLQQLFAVNLKTLGLLALGFIGVFVAGFILGGLTLVVGSSARIGYAAIVIVVLAVFMLLLQTAYFKYSIATARGRRVSAGTCLRVGRRKMLGLVGVGLLMGLALFVGFLLFVIPGIVFLYWFFWAPYVYVDQEIGVFEAFKKSKNYSQGNAAELFGLQGAALTVSILGMVPLVGFLFSLLLGPVLQVGFSYRYVSFRAAKNNQLQKGETHKANYVGIALIPAVIGLMIVLSLFFGPQNRAPEQEFSPAGAVPEARLQVD